jgi:nicotinamide mononucleotide (NMN) deamidase PncC
LTNLIATTPGSCEYFKGSLIINSDKAREKLNVQSRCSNRASKETALMMASAARAMLSADIGLSIDGSYEINGNEPSSDIFVAIDEGSKSKILNEHYAGTVQQIARRTVNFTLVNFQNYISAL